jgi:large subunit ribosomal protein L4
MAAIFSNLKLEGKIALVLDKNDDNVALSARNIPGVFVTTVDHASVLDLLSTKHVVLTENAVKQYEEVLG